METADRLHFRGMMPLMPTAVTDSGDLDESSQRRVIDYCLESGVAALGHFGFASEFYKIGREDRRDLIELIVEHVAGRLPVFFGITAPSTRIMLDYAAEAEALGADFLMVSLPYIDIPDADGAYALFERLAGVAALPLMIQDTPATNPILTPQLIERLVSQFESIQLVKAEGTNFVAKTEQLMKRLGNRVQVIGGAGGKHMIHLLRMGVEAFITGTEALDIHAAVVNSFLAGDRDEAARIYFERLLPYFTFYNDHPEELLKKMLHMRGVLDCPAPVDPPNKPPMSDIEWREFQWILDRIGYDANTVNRSENNKPHGSEGRA